jgi:hypothetical protein
MVTAPRVRATRFRDTDLDKGLGEQVRPRVANVVAAPIGYMNAERLKGLSLEPFAQGFTLHQ